MTAGRARALLYVVLVAGAGLRLAWVGRPLDARIGGAPWREADYTQIARNFARDGGSFLYPRVDWRGTTPGFVEMEWPLLPWIAGRLPVREEARVPLMRLLSAALSIGSLLLFSGLARRLLEPAAALFAVAAVAINPLLVYLAAAVQPDALMLFLALAAVVLLLRWDATPRPGLLACAGLALGAAIMAKAPAACLGILFAYVVWRRLGPVCLRTPIVWAAALLALAPPAAWYAWAHRFWLLYGMSMGLSNEAAFIGTDMLVPPGFVVGLLKWETLGVLTPAGWILLAAAAFAVRPRPGAVCAWLLATWVFDVAAARTTADNWAFYYHGLSCEPAALLMGAGLVAVARGLPGSAGPRLPARLAGGAAALLAVLVLAGEAAALAALVDRRDHDPDLHAMRDCALRFAPQIPAGATIVARGGPLVEEHGRPVAHNESMLFAWLDRTGFSYADEELSVATLESIARRGGRFWIAGRGRVHGELKEAVRRRFQLLDRCPEGYDLYDLTHAGTGGGAP